MDIQEHIWAQKYRPADVASMTLTPNTAALVNQYIASKQFPHLLLFGRAGSGKTTIATILIKECGCDALVLNASGEDRGVDTMKTRVVQFARSMPPSWATNKVVFFDEFDGCTREAQNALKNTIELYSKSCRFIFTANTVNKVIEPIRSRCTEIPLLQFPKDRAITMAAAILTAEGVAYDSTELPEIIDRYYPDIRSMINALQRCSIAGQFSAARAVNVGVPPEEVVACIAQGRVLSLRKLVAGMTDFMYLYQYLFDNIGKICSGDSVEKAAIAICEHLYYDATIADREINFTTACIELMVAGGVSPDFTK